MKFQTIDIRDGLDLSFDRSAVEFDEIVGLSKQGIHATGSGLKVRLRVERVGATILVRGQAQASLSTTCVRCLGPLVEDLSAEIDLALFHRSEERAPDEELELSEDDLDVAYYDEPEIDVSSFVREAILLELPSYPSHAEGYEGCVPLTVEEAPVERVDPRWASLAALKDKMSVGRNKPN